MLLEFLVLYHFDFCAFSCFFKLIILLTGPKGNDDIPTSIFQGWRYAKELENEKTSFVEAEEGEIVFQDSSKAHST